MLEGTIVAAEDNVPVGNWVGTLTIFGVDLRCYVLDDGRRVISAEDMGKLWGAIDDPNAPRPTEAELEALGRFLNSGSIDGHQRSN